MKKELTVEGLSCLECLQKLAKKLAERSVVESVSIDNDRKIAFVRGKKQTKSTRFMSALSKTPDFLREMNEAEYCNCCSQLHFSFQ